MKAGAVTVVGLGPGDPRGIPPEALDRMRRADVVMLRTERHPAVSRLAAEGIAYETFDEFYEREDTLEAVYRSIAGRLFGLAGEGREVVYAVPGHPGVAEASVRELLLAARTGPVRVTVIGAMSGLDAIFSLVPLDPGRGLVILDPEGLRSRGLGPRRDLVVLQVDDSLLASEVKLCLLGHYPPDHPVMVIQAAGVPGQEKVTACALATLDHHRFDHLTSVYVPALPPAKRGPRPGWRFPLDPLVEIMRRLRSPTGCPWDREQTHQSLRNYVLEEAYELAEAVDLGDTNRLVEELGDLLLQVVFHGVIAMEEGAFDLNQVVQGIVEKLRRRHPHVFGGPSLSTSEEVLAQWGRLKARETGEGALGNIPRNLPALLRAARVQARARAAGCGPAAPAVPPGLLPAVNEGSAETYGQLLLAVVRAAAEQGVDAEAALHEATDRLMVSLEGQTSSGRNQLEQG